MLIEIYFSPTGGSKRVSNIISCGISEEHKTIDLTDPAFKGFHYNIEKDNLCILTVPSFGGRVPALAAERISQLKGNCAKIVLVSVFGNREFEDTLVELEDLTKEAGFIPIAGVSAVAEHSLVREVAKQRPDPEDVKVLKEFANKIKYAFENSETSPRLPGNRPYKDLGKFPFIPSTNDNCTQCGTCYINCPPSAINFIDKRKIDGSKCISCMRCISVCPYDAKYLNEEIKERVRGFLSQSAIDRKEPELYL